MSELRRRRYIATLPILASVAGVAIDWSSLEAGESPPLRAAGQRLDLYVGNAGDGGVYVAPPGSDSAAPSGMLVANGTGAWIEDVDRSHHKNNPILLRAVADTEQCYVDVWDVVR